MKNNAEGHLTNFDSMPDLEESPTAKHAVEFDLKQEWENVIYNRDQMRIIERDNEERGKVASKKRKIIKTTWRTR